MGQLFKYGTFPNNTRKVTTLEYITYQKKVEHVKLIPTYRTKRALHTKIVYLHKYTKHVKYLPREQKVCVHVNYFNLNNYVLEHNIFPKNTGKCPFYKFFKKEYFKV